MNILEALMPVAESANMGWYFKQLIQEMKYEDEYREDECTNCGCMKQILEDNSPTEDNLLLVNAKNGVERRAFHAWAESKGYSHVPIKTSLFSDNVIYYCKECKRAYYDNEMNISADWSTISSGVCYGSTIKCFHCDSYYDADDPEDSDIKRRGEAFNAVMIGVKLPLLSKRETRTHKRKNSIERQNNDIQLLNKIGKRSIKVLPLTHFDEPLEINGKKISKNNYKS